MFEDITVLVLWAVATYVVATVVNGFLSVFFYATDSVKQIELLRHLNNIIHRVRVEKDKDVYYWYDEDDHEFLAQGSSDDEIIDRLKTRFPTHIFYLPTQHLISEKTDWQPKLHHVEKIDL